MSIRIIVEGREELPIEGWEQRIKAGDFFSIIDREWSPLYLTNGACLLLCMWRLWWRLCLRSRDGYRLVDLSSRCQTKYRVKLLSPLGRIVHLRPRGLCVFATLSGVHSHTTPLRQIEMPQEGRAVWIGWATIPPNLPPNQLSPPPSPVLHRCPHLVITIALQLLNRPFGGHLQPTCLNCQVNTNPCLHFIHASLWTFWVFWDLPFVKTGNDTIRYNNGKGKGVPRIVKKWDSFQMARRLTRDSRMSVWLSIFVLAL